MATKKVDPRIFLPIVEGYEYQERTPVEGRESDAGPVEELELPISPGVGLQPPETVQIVDQVFRKGKDGRVVVDIVLEVQDVVGATEYEVRTSIA